MKRLIVNADDFGLTQGVNKAIVEAHEQGIVTSASLMVGSKAFAEAASLAKRYPQLGLGVHLTLANGRPVSPPAQVPTLIQRDGCFSASPVAFIARLALGRIKVEEIARELRAQIKRALDAGVRVTHVDGHKHLHVYPAILPVVIEVMRELGIKRMRLPFEFPHSMRGPNGWGHAPSYWLVSLAARAGRRKLLESQIAFPEHFFGLFHTGSLSESWLQAVLETLPEGTSEILCHPGYDDEELRATGTRLGRERRRELQILTNQAIIDLVKKRGIELINYGDLG